MNVNDQEDILYNYWVDSPYVVVGSAKNKINAIYRGKDLEEKLEKFFVTTLARRREYRRRDMFETH